MEIKGYRIAVVEDETLQLEEYEEELTRKGYIVDGYLTRYELEKMIEEKEKYDVILMDVTLQEHVNIREEKGGFIAARNIRKHLKCPIIFVSRHITADFEIEALSTGDDYLKKPIDYDVLCARIEVRMNDYSFKKEEDENGILPLRNIIEVNTQANGISIEGTEVTVFANAFRCGYGQTKIMRKEHILTLTPREACILDMLIRNRGKKIHKEDLKERVSTDATIETIVSNLRKKMYKVDNRFNKLFAVRGGYYLWNDKEGWAQRYEKVTELSS